MKARLTICVIVASAVALTALAAESDHEAGPSYWMKKKLDYAQRLLGGLARGDFDEISQSARSMNALTHVERWAHANQAGYRDQLKIFQNANEHIIRAADKGDLDDATEGFRQLTTSCVNCHKVVRDVGRTR